MTNFVRLFMCLSTMFVCKVHSSLLPYFIFVFSIFYIWLSCLCIFTFLKMILFIFRDKGRKGKREGEKHWCVRDTLIGCLLHISNWGPGPQPRHVPWLGVKPVTFPFAGWHSIHWATPARACLYILNTSPL